jgi:hypothetical protein
MDIPGIEIVIQWKATNLDLNTLVQRFGRGARDPKTNAFCILLTEQDLVLPEASEGTIAKASDPAHEIGTSTEEQSTTAGSRKRPRDESNSHPRNVRRREDTDGNESLVPCAQDGCSIESVGGGRTETIHSPNPPQPRTAASSHKRKQPAQADGETPEKRAKKESKVDAGVASLIRASTEGGDGCRRVPIDRLYGNDKLVTPTMVCLTGQAVNAMSQRRTTTARLASWEKYGP